MPFDETTISEEITEIENTTDRQSDSTFEKVAEIIAKTTNCNIVDIKFDSNLRDLGVDSLSTLTILFDLEEEFDLEIPNELIPTIQTVNDILEKLNNMAS